MVAITTYTFLKFLHVLLAIVAVGFNASYGVLLTRAARDPQHLGHVLRTVKTLDDRFANPAYGLLFVTGMAMVVVGDVDLTQFWLAAAIGLYAFAILLGLFVYTPTLRHQIRAFETGGASSPEFRALAARGTVVGIVLAVDVVAIVFLMVTQPVL